MGSITETVLAIIAAIVVVAGIVGGVVLTLMSSHWTICWFGSMLLIMSFLHFSYTMVLATDDFNQGKKLEGMLNELKRK